MRAEARSLPSCRFCGNALDEVFADLGRTPLANSNLRPDDIAGERSFPLVARVCGSCFLVQVDDAVPAEAIFSNYDYLSSTSPDWVRRAGVYARMMKDRFGLDERSRVVEVASNDGYLLQHFLAAGIPSFGIEPAANVAALARERGVLTDVEFFSARIATAMMERGLSADLMVANNVLAHVPEIADFVAGFAIMLKPDGVATFEFAHLLNLIERIQFDTIYHEHYSYLSLLVTERILAGAGLRIFDVEELPTHGGSLRVFACHAGASHLTTPAVEAIRRRERLARLDSPDGYRGFSAAIATVRQEFRAFLARTRAEGRRIAAYGAAAKGNTFLNVCGVTRDDILEIYDRNPLKQGKLLPGTHIPIVDPERIADTRPDYLLVLPWNLLAEVRESMAARGGWTGRFAVADPHIRLL